MIKGHIWLHLDYSSSIKDYIKGLERLLLFNKHIDFFEPGHGECIPFEDVHEVIELANLIEKQKVDDKHIITFAGEGLLFLRGEYGLVCSKMSIKR